MKAVNSNMKPQTNENTSVIKYCCQKHVTHAVKVVYLPHFATKKPNTSFSDFIKSI